MTHATGLFRGLLLALLVPTVTRAQQPAVENPHGALTQPCAVCHSPQAWKPARISSGFDHNKVGGGSLEGAHASVACKSCHASLTFQGAPRDCIGCHKDPHRGEVGTNCARCHTFRNFLDRTEMGRAHQLTRFALTGAHVAVDCEECHTGAGSGQMTFVARPTDCNSCHLKDYQAARNPDHTAAGFPHDCQACHVTVAWMGARFDHSATRFPLTGAHLAVTCTRCHGTGGFGALPTGCASCHQADYNTTSDPNHQAAQLPTDCTSCHSTSVWTGAQFAAHNANYPPYFPIYSGRHPQAVWRNCSTCHVNASDYHVYDCRSCHQDAHNAHYPRLTCADVGCHANGRAP